MTFEGFDLETHPIGPGQIAPPPVVLSRSSDGGSLAVPGSEEWAEALGDALARDDGTVALFCNAKFDLSVLAVHDPDLIPLIFDGLAEGRIQDVILREKLINLARFGSIEMIPMPNGANKKMSYAQSELEKDYLGIDRTEDKKGSDSWRTNYRELEGVPLDQWPIAAVKYAIDDAVNLVAIAEGQELKRQDLIRERGIDPWGCHGDEAVLRHRCELDFALALMSLEGMCTNTKKIKELQDWIAEELAPERIDLLVKHKIITPAKPEMPYSNGAKDHAVDCPRKGDCDCPVKMKKAQKEKCNKTVLQRYVKDLCERKGLPLYMTDPSDKFPEGQIQVNSDWLKQYAHFDPVTEQYQHRQSLQKLVTTELPRMMDVDGNPADRVHPNFDPLKETGRTSSFGGKLYPSFNIQNVHAKVRECFEAPEGWGLLSIDYGAMELGTAAQTMLRLFGFSVLAEKINAGFCAHAYLGAHLAYRLDPDFHKACDAESIPQGDQLYHAFRELENDPSTKDFYKHWRKFAKPTGLGYPGGLGPETFIEYARATYEVDLIKQCGSLEAAIELAAELREIWMNTFPEFREYLKKYINLECIDPWNVGPKRDDGRYETRYCYTTPMGMHRANAPYCAVANGMALQSPSAEGATRAVIEFVRAALDETVGSPLYLRNLPVGFVHDELLSYVRLDDPDLDELVAAEIKIMVDCMKRITPDVRASAEPALMIQWNKAAEAVYDEHGRLQVWHPKKKESA